LFVAVDAGEGGRRGRWRWTSSRRWSRWRCGAARRRRAGLDSIARGDCGNQPPAVPPPVPPWW